VEKKRNITDRQRLRARSGEPTRPAWTVGWHAAIFQHYCIRESESVGRFLPEGLSLDLYDGDSWLSVVSFRMTGMRWRGSVRLPFAGTYPQINVRIYVVGPDGIPGVFFLRNLVGNRLAARMGRRLYGMPYVYQPLQLESRGERVGCTAVFKDALTHTVTGYPGKRLTGHKNDPASLRFFLTERYPLFSQKSGMLHIARMLHPPWPLQLLEDAEQRHGAVSKLGLINALEPYPELHYSAGVPVQMWPARRIQQSREVSIG
jgi:uncharacterized protein YqjF (DUF2071 family)